MLEWRRVDFFLTGFVWLLCREERNVIEAAAKGASSSISLVANVAAMLLTFFAFIAFFNSILSYIGSMVGYSKLSFQASLRILKSCFIFRKTVTSEPSQRRLGLVLRTGKNQDNIRDFKIQRRGGNENAALNVNLRSFSLYSDYFYPLTLSNVGKPS